MIKRIKMRAGFLSAAMVLAVPLSGCSTLGGGSRLTAGCGVVVDGSGSADSKRGFNVIKLLQEQLTHELYADGCRYVVFAPISGSSRASVCSSPMIDVDPDVTGTVERAQLRGSRRSQALKAALTLKDCITNDPRSVQGSDVLGGLARIASARPPGAKSYRLIVFSDFVNYEGRRPGAVNLGSANLSTPQTRRALLDRLAREGRIPDLSNDHLTTFGYGVLQSRDPARFAGFDAFWRELITDRAKCLDAPGVAATS